MSEGIESLLRAHEAEGQLESQGTFSIDPRAARLKVAQFGLDGPEKGLLRLMQLAVASGCQKIELRMGADTVDIRVFEAQGDLFNLDKVSDSVTTALLACLYAGYVSGRILDSENTWGLSRTAFDRAELLDLEPGVVKILLQRGAPPGFWARLRALVEYRTEDTTVLQERLRFCPVPVTLDGRLINGARSLQEQSAMDLYLTAPEVLRVHGVWCSAGNYTTRYTFRRGVHARADHNPGKYWDTFETVYSSADPATFGFQGTVEMPTMMAHLWVPMRAKGPGKLSFVKHGVVVGSAPLDLGFPIHGAVSGNTVDVDISGLAAVHNRKVSEITDHLIAQMRLEIKQMLRRSPTPDVRRRLRMIHRA